MKHNEHDVNNNNNLDPGTTRRAYNNNKIVLYISCINNRFKTFSPLTLSLRITRFTPKKKKNMKYLFYTHNNKGIIKVTGT